MELCAIQIYTKKNSHLGIGFHTFEAMAETARNSLHFGTFLLKLLPSTKTLAIPKNLYGNVGNRQLFSFSGDHLGYSGGLL